MGATSSQIPGPPGGGNSHTQIPEDAVPYGGPSLEYRVALVSSKLKVSFGGYATSDVNEYMATLAQQYAEYFKLDTFFRVPFSMQTSGFATVIRSYQAIFSRPSAFVPSPEGWQLQVVVTSFKLSANMGALFSRNNVDTSMGDIYSQLNTKSAEGGRLVCMECTGESGKQSWTSVVFGVNLFFNIPTHPNPTIYTYIAYSTPMHVQQSFRGTTDIQMDISGTLAMHLNVGWRLIDIIIPQHETSMSTYGKKGRRYLPQMNTIWFFEKEVSRVQANDNTPHYQVTVVDVYVPVKYGFGTATAQCDMANLLSQMGQRGWELVCVLDTPQAQVSGMSITVVLKAFFQRALVNNIPFQPPPPSYSQPPPAGFK